MQEDHSLVPAPTEMLDRHSDLLIIPTLGRQRQGCPKLACLTKSACSVESPCLSLQDRDQSTKTPNVNLCPSHSYIFVHVHLHTHVYLPTWTCLVPHSIYTLKRKNSQDALHGSSCPPHLLRALHRRVLGPMLLFCTLPAHPGLSWDPVLHPSLLRSGYEMALISSYVLTLGCLGMLQSL